MSTDRSLVLRGATVIDVRRGRSFPDLSVTVEDGRISAVGPSSSISPAPGSRSVDASGKFVFPGLWDMHGHLTDAGEGALVRLVRNGVTGVRDLGGDLARVDAWRDEIRRGARVGPEIFRAGPFLDGPKTGVSNRETIRTPDEARQAVRKWKSAGVDFLKVHNGVDRVSFFALMDEARKERIPVAVHLPVGVSSEEASNAGAASLEHVETLHESELWRPGAIAHTVEQAAQDNLGPGGAAVLRRLAANHTHFVPTIVAYERGFVLWTEDPEAIGPRLSIHRKNLELVGRMKDAGVQIMAGSDFSDWGMEPGVDLHNELALLVEAGLSPMEALRSATMVPADFLGISDNFGSIEPGHVADLVVVDADPLKNISHTRKIRAVVREGRYFPLEQLGIDPLPPSTVHPS